MDKEYIIGRNPIIERMKAGKKIYKIYIQGASQGKIDKLLDLAKERSIDLEYVDKKTLDNLSQGRVHQGVVGEIPSYKYASLEEIFARAKSLGQDPLIVILDGIEDPHNLGSIIRTAECAGVHGIVIPKHRAASVNETVYKTSAGAVDHMLVSMVTNITDTLKELKDRGLWIYGSDLAGENYHYETDLKGPIGIVVGNEGKGMSRLVKENCDLLIKIPMFGKISSMNAANASSVIIYEVIRQRHAKG